MNSTEVSSLAAHNTQQPYIDNLSNIKADLRDDKASVRTTRGKVSGIAIWIRPDIAFAMRRLNRVTPENINSETTKSCNELNDYIEKTVKRNIIFCKLYFTSFHVVFYSDASFSGNLDLSSQTGSVIILKDKHGNSHVLHWFSKKYPSVTGSMLAAENVGLLQHLIWLLLYAMCYKRSTSDSYRFMD
jgi:hypothetical protein